MNNLRNLALWILIALLLVFLFNMFQNTGQHQNPSVISYTQFNQQAVQGQVSKVTIQDKQIKGELTNGQPFTTYMPDDPSLVPMLKEHNVNITAAPPDDGINLMSVFINWFPMLLLIGVWVFFLRQMQAGGGKAMGFGKSRAKLLTERTGRVTFEDVAGVDEAKDELHEIIDFLKRPGEFTRLGAHIPRGILLVGPPGTGKTLLARAVAGEAGVPFFSTNGAEFVEMFVGVGAARVRDLFEQARQTSPCIIFIDELDALGRARGVSPVTGQDEKEQTLNQLLAEMDGFDRSVAIVILAATNRPEILDPALLRAGRFDRQVLVDRPDKKGRVEILRIHMKKLKLTPDVKLDDIAALTPGFTGADLANLANEAAVLATRRGAAAIAMADFTGAVERIVAGLEKKSRILIPRERRIVAYHEMGHALVALAIPGSDPVQKVSIIPRGIAALGYTMQHPTEDRFLMGRQELEDKMTILLGGRAAEILLGDDVSTGAADDLAKATDVARGMVMRFGMDERLGPVAWDTEQGNFMQQPGVFWRQRRYSETTANEIDLAVRARLDGALARAIGILRENRATLDEGATALLAHETLNADEIPRPKPVRAAAAE